MLEKVKNTIKKYNMFEKGCHVVLGLSGGADSCALLRILLTLSDEYGLIVTAVHINHLLRGKEAERDQFFVRDTCRGLGVHCLFYQRDVSAFAKEMGFTIEQAGRELRYTCFQEAAAQLGADKIAVAHNLNDQGETVLMRLIRGAGLWGLTGIAPVRGNIVRPLIECGRKEIECYLKGLGQGYTEDSSNFTAAYTRNNLRINIIPAIEAEINPGFMETIKRTQEILSCEDDFMEEQGVMAYNKTVRLEEGVLRIDKEGFLKLHEALRLRVARLCVKEMSGSVTDFEYSHFKAIAAICKLENGKKRSLHGGLIVQNSYKDILIYSNIDASNIDMELKEGDFIQLGDRGMYLSLSAFYPRLEKKYENISTKTFDYDKINGSLKLRQRMAGDRIFINKIGGRKKLKDYFIDNKVERIERDKIPLVALGGDVLWILDGTRIANDAYLAGENSRKLYIQLWRLANDEQY